jgi:hypothetical protein
MCNIRQCCHLEAVSLGNEEHTSCFLHLLNKIIVHRGHFVAYISKLRGTAGTFVFTVFHTRNKYSILWYFLY